MEALEVPESKDVLKQLIALTILYKQGKEFIVSPEAYQTLVAQCVPPGRTEVAGISIKHIPVLENPYLKGQSIIIYHYEKGDP